VAALGKAGFCSVAGRAGNLSRKRSVCYPD